MKKHIPNIITLANLVCGCLAVIFAYEQNYLLVLGLVTLAAVFDFLDGLVARLLKAYSELGKELDSLADLVSFGFAPAVVVVSMLSQTIGNYAYIGLVIVAFSALRLAKFNIDDSQTDSFIGMPTPANALFWIGLGFSYNDFFSQHIFITISLVLVMSYLLISKLPMFSLKIKNFAFKENFWQYILIFTAISLLLVLKIDAIMWIIIAYILLSVIKNSIDYFTKNNQ